MKKSMLLVMSAVSLSIMVGCGGEKSQEGGKGRPGPGNPPGPQAPMPKPVVVVPEAIKGKWKSVVLNIQDKESKSSKEYTINIGEKFKLPGSDMTVVVKEFFPAFAMQGTSITSISNEPDNPAAQVAVTEGGADVFNGWLFAKYPTTHAFSHPRYAITLKEGLRKK